MLLFYILTFRFFSYGAIIMLLLRWNDMDIYTKLYYMACIALGTFIAEYGQYKKSNVVEETSAPAEDEDVPDIDAPAGARLEGQIARYQGLPRDANRYKKNTALYYLWDAGYTERPRMGS